MKSNKTLDIVIPIAAINIIADNEKLHFPLPLIEVAGKTLIEYALTPFKKIAGEKRFIFIIREEDCVKYHFDNSLKLLVPDCEIVIVKGQTSGAICSVLMAIDILRPVNHLIITNFDQFLDYNINSIVEYFFQNEADAGLLTFNSIHPRWSYARLEESAVLETAEKNPISSSAIAGFYYFRKTEMFLTGAFDVIKKDDDYNGNYYTSAVFNQLILGAYKVLNYTLPREKYYSFYSAQKVKEFELNLNKLV